MELRILCGQARWVRRAAATIAVVAACGLAGTIGAEAQQPAPAPPKPAPAKPAKPAPGPQKPVQAAPPAGPAAPAPAPAPQAQGDQQQVPVIYSPWTKVCGKDQNQADAKQVCLIVKEARLESGQFIAGAVLIEPDGVPQKILRITLPLGMQLMQGTRVILDQGTPDQRPYVICFPNGCMSDYPADAEMVSKMKKGQGLVVQAINSTGQPINLVLPLADFAKAYDGPPTDPKVLEEQQKKLQEELQKKAEEARKKLLESPQPQAGAPNAVPATR
ncbi:MAG: invasion associated locus B family protein [Xanthobacteraceae bacterium]